MACHTIAEEEVASLTFNLEESADEFRQRLAAQLSVAAAVGIILPDGRLLRELDCTRPMHEFLGR